MTKRTRWRFSPEYKEEAVARLSESGATHGSVAAELGITPTQLKTWRLELKAAGSATAIATQRSEAAELAQLRRDNRWLKEEVEVLRKASAFFRSVGGEDMRRSSPSLPPTHRRTPSGSCTGSWALPAAAIMPGSVERLKGLCANLGDGLLGSDVS